MTRAHLRVVFLVEASPDPQTITMLLDKDLWSQHGFSVAVEQYLWGVDIPAGPDVPVFKVAPTDVMCAICPDVAPDPNKLPRGFGDIEPVWFLHYWRRRLQNLDAAAVVVGSEVLQQGRTAVLAAHSLGIPSVQLQHGYPVGWWGYAPSLATKVFSWGPSSTEKFISFGVDRSKVVEIGSPRLAGLLDRVTQQRRIRTELKEKYELPAVGKIVLLAEGYRGLAQSTLDSFLEVVVGTLVNRADVHILVKTHPAETLDAVERKFANAQKAVQGRIHIRTMDLDEALVIADVALNFQSTTGLEAAAVGVPIAAFVDRGDVAHSGVIPVELPIVHTSDDFTAFLDNPVAVGRDRIDLQHIRELERAREAFFSELSHLVEASRDMEPSQEVLALLTETPCARCGKARRTMLRWGRNSRELVNRVKGLVFRALRKLDFR